MTDSHLILASYQKWGEGCVERLIGDFVFAIWDARKQSLFCARDPLGIKHFYYYHDRGRLFAFASEIKALFALPEVPQRLNEAAVANHLLPTHEDKTSTLYQSIARLPANHCMSISRESLKLRQCWAPNLKQELKLRSDNEYAEAFKDVFTEAVRCRLRSAFPVGSMLSGGLDSSSISCVAENILAKEGKEPLHTFSAIWPSIAHINPKIDERKFMSSVVATGDFNHHDVRVDRISPLIDSEKIIWHQDGPVSAPNMYMDWTIFKTAQQNGVRVLLGGTDGDTTVSYGYEDLEAFVRRGWWIKFFREVAALSRNMPRSRRNFRKLVWSSAFAPLIPELAKQSWRLLQGQPREVDERDTLPAYCRNRPINSDFANRIKVKETFWALQNNSFPSDMTSREDHWRAISCGMWSYLLETYEKAGASFSLDLRYPFFDRRVIEFCLALPPGQRLNGGWTRSILRRAMSGILPTEVQWRTSKGNLSPGLNLQLLEHEQEALDDVVVHSHKHIQKYVDAQAVGAVYRRYAANPLQCNDEVFTLMLIINLSSWLRHAGFTQASELGVKELACV
ncbi:MAG: asparagine synthase-related protein [Pyrinomonadaceae bacterium]